MVRCASAGKPGGFVESFVSASAAEMEYLDRYSIHPEEGERVEAGLEAQRWMRASPPPCRAVSW